jgi:cytochrome c oxidase subunit 1
VAVRTEPIYPVPWHRGRFASWLVTTDHKRIGLLYIWTSLAFFLLGGLMALVIRTELITPEAASVVDRDVYNQLFTMHGLTMIFLVVVPILAGFGNFVVPLMIGAADMAFPRLNALSYWLFLLGGIVLYSAWFSAGGPADTGWYLYPPYSIASDTNVDLTILGLHLLAVGSLFGAINFVATVHTMRTAGMTWMRLPLFTWAIYTYSWLLITTLPVVGAGLTMLLLDRQAGTHFFTPDSGGNAVLYQHMFWFFGHPEVYVMILPAFGIVSEVIPVFARKPIFGYTAIAFSTIGIAFVSMLVWAHHMFTVGLPNVLNGFFMVASVLVAVPTGVKVINWIATLWRGNISFTTPMLFALGLISTFTLGGISGVFVAAFPFDWQVHDIL